MFWSIRTKFLAGFIFGVMITFAMALFVSYIRRINKNDEFEKNVKNKIDDFGEIY